MSNLLEKGFAEVRVRRLVEAIARQVKLETDDNLSILFPRFHQAIYAKEAQLMILPTSAGLAFARRWSEDLIREARCDLLLVCWPLGLTPDLAFARWRPGAVGWVEPLQFWMSSRQVLWLVTDGATTGSRHAIELENKLLTNAEMPWSEPEKAHEGACRAERWLAAECLRADTPG
ncbi:MAG: hypothetical protein ABJO64_11255 [Nitratireductor sp.]